MLGVSFSLICARRADFKSAYRKSYPTRAEEAKRFAIFSENLVLADRYNAEQLESGGGPAFGVTKFSDKSQDVRNQGRALPTYSTFIY